MTVPDPLCLGFEWNQRREEGGRGGMLPPLNSLMMHQLVSSHVYSLFQ